MFLRGKTSSLSLCSVFLSALATFCVATALSHHHFRLHPPHIEDFRRPYGDQDLSFFESLHDRVPHHDSRIGPHHRLKMLADSSRSVNNGKSRLSLPHMNRMLNIKQYIVPTQQTLKDIMVHNVMPLSTYRKLTKNVNQKRSQCPEINSSRNSSVYTGQAFSNLIHRCDIHNPTPNNTVSKRKPSEVASEDRNQGTSIKPELVQYLEHNLPPMNNVSINSNDHLHDILENLALKGYERSAQPKKGGEESIFDIDYDLDDDDSAEYKVTRKGRKTNSTPSTTKSDKTTTCKSTTVSTATTETKCVTTTTCKPETSTISSKVKTTIIGTEESLVAGSNGRYQNMSIPFPYVMPQGGTETILSNGTPPFFQPGYQQVPMLQVQPNGALSYVLVNSIASQQPSVTPTPYVIQPQQLAIQMTQRTPVPPSLDPQQLPPQDAQQLPQQQQQQPLPVMIPQQLLHHSLSPQVPQQLSTQLPPHQQQQQQMLQQLQQQQAQQQQQQTQQSLATITPIPNNTMLAQGRPRQNVTTQPQKINQPLLSTKSTQQSGQNTQVRPTTPRPLTTNLPPQNPPVQFQNVQNSQLLYPPPQIMQAPLQPTENTNLTLLTSPDSINLDIFGLVQPKPILNRDHLETTVPNDSSKKQHCSGYMVQQQQYNPPPPPMNIISQVKTCQVPGTPQQVCHKCHGPQETTTVCLQQHQEMPSNGIIGPNSENQQQNIPPNTPEEINNSNNDIPSQMVLERENIHNSGNLHSPPRPSIENLDRMDGIQLSQDYGPLRPWMKRKHGMGRFGKGRYGKGQPQMQHPRQVHADDDLPFIVQPHDIIVNLKANESATDRSLQDKSNNERNIVIIPPTNKSQNYILTIGIRPVKDDETVKQKTSLSPPVTMTLPPRSTTSVKTVSTTERQTEKMEQSTTTVMKLQTEVNKQESKALKEEQFLGAKELPNSFFPPEEKNQSLITQPTGNGVTTTTMLSSDYSPTTHSENTQTKFHYLTKDKYFYPGVQEISQRKPSRYRPMKQDRKFSKYSQFRGAKQEHFVPKSSQIKLSMPNRHFVKDGRISPIGSEPYKFKTVKIFQPFGQDTSAMKYHHLNPIQKADDYMRRKQFISEQAKYLPDNPQYNFTEESQNLLQSVNQLKSHNEYEPLQSTDIHSINANDQSINLELHKAEQDKKVSKELLVHPAEKAFVKNSHDQERYVLRYPQSRLIKQEQYLGYNTQFHRGGDSSFTGHEGRYLDSNSNKRVEFPIASSKTRPNDLSVQQIDNLSDLHTVDNKRPYSPRFPEKLLYHVQYQFHPPDHQKPYIPLSLAQNWVPQRTNQTLLSTYQIDQVFPTYRFQTSNVSLSWEPNTLYHATEYLPERTEQTLEIRNHVSEGPFENLQSQQYPLMHDDQSPSNTRGSEQGLLPLGQQENTPEKSVQYENTFTGPLYSDNVQQNQAQQNLPIQNPSLAYEMEQGNLKNGFINLPSRYETGQQLLKMPYDSQQQDTDTLNHRPGNSLESFASDDNISNYIVQSPLENFNLDHGSIENISPSYNYGYEQYMQPYSRGNQTSALEVNQNLLNEFVKSSSDTLQTDGNFANHVTQTSSEEVEPLNVLNRIFERPSPEADHNTTSEPLLESQSIANEGHPQIRRLPNFPQEMNGESGQRIMSSGNLRYAFTDDSEESALVADELSILDQLKHKVKAPHESLGIGHTKLLQTQSRNKLHSKLMSRKKENQDSMPEYKESDSDDNVSAKKTNDSQDDKEWERRLWPKFDNEQTEKPGLLSFQTEKVPFDEDDWEEDNESLSRKTEKPTRKIKSSRKHHGRRRNKENVHRLSLFSSHNHKRADMDSPMELSKAEKGNEPRYSEDSITTADQSLVNIKINK